MLAHRKLTTVHSHISKDLEDTEVSDEENKVVHEEVEKVMKDEIYQKA